MVVMIVICTLYLLTVNLLADEQQDNFQAPESEDFSSLIWSEAFDKLQAKFSREYGFTDWKKIDWPALYNQFKPRMNQSQESNDFTAYYLTLREYVHSIPDGHVHMNSLSEIDNRYIGGGFGFSIVKLTDGKIVVIWIDESSEVYTQRMRTGAELVEWNGCPFKQF